MAARKQALKPEPKTISIVCSACGLDWKRHGSEPTLEDCVRLLKADLAARHNIFVNNSAGGTSGIPLRSVAS